jgi:hypothetical protein
VILLEPVKRVADEVAAYLVGPGTVEVDRRTPGRPVALREVGSELGEYVALGAQMVVDHVEDHAESGAVRGVDQAA